MIVLTILYYLAYLLTEISAILRSTTPLPRPKFGAQQFAKTAQLINFVNSVSSDGGHGFARSGGYDQFYPFKRNFDYKIRDMNKNRWFQSLLDIMQSNEEPDSSQQKKLRKTVRIHLINNPEELDNYQKQLKKKSRRLPPSFGSESESPSGNGPYEEERDRRYYPGRNIAGYTLRGRKSPKAADNPNELIVIKELRSQALASTEVSFQPSFPDDDDESHLEDINLEAKDVEKNNEETEDYEKGIIKPQKLPASEKEDDASREETKKINYFSLDVSTPADLWDIQKDVGDYNKKRSIWEDRDGNWNKKPDSYKKENKLIKNTKYKSNEKSKEDSDNEDVNRVKDKNNSKRYDWDTNNKDRDDDRSKKSDLDKIRKKITKEEGWDDRDKWQRGEWDNIDKDVASVKDKEIEQENAWDLRDKKNNDYKKEKYKVKENDNIDEWDKPRVYKKIDDSGEKKKDQKDNGWNKEKRKDEDDNWDKPYKSDRGKTSEARDKSKRQYARERPDWDKKIDDDDDDDDDGGDNGKKHKENDEYIIKEINWGKKENDGNKKGNNWNKKDDWNKKNDDWDKKDNKWDKKDNENDRGKKYNDWNKKDSSWDKKNNAKNRKDEWDKKDDWNKKQGDDWDKKDTKKGKAGGLKNTAKEWDEIGLDKASSDERVRDKKPYNNVGKKQKKVSDWDNDVPKNNPIKNKRYENSYEHVQHKVARGAGSFFSTSIPYAGKKRIYADK